MGQQEVRAETIELLKKLLIGPLEQNEVIPSNPSDTYLTGILWPMDSIISEAEDDSGSNGYASDDSDGVELSVPGYRAIRPCSIGLTCAIDYGAKIEISLDGTSRYIPIEKTSQPVGKEEISDESMQAVSLSGKPEVLLEKSVASSDSDEAEENDFIELEWRRIPLEYSVIIPENETRGSWRTSEFCLPDGSLVNDSDVAVDIKRRVCENRVILTATLINMASKAEGVSRDRANLFQARLCIRAISFEDKSAIRSREVRTVNDDEDDLTNLLLYRNDLEFAVGHGISTEWPLTKKDAVPWVATSWMPSSSVTGTSPAGHISLKALGSENVNLFSAQWLAREEDREEICKALDFFCDVYSNWISKTLDSRIGSFSGKLQNAAKSSLNRCQKTLERMLRGVSTLRSNENAWAAFVVSNRAMNDQSILASKGDKARPLVWRPFQLAFLLLVIPSVVDDHDPDRETMDLLWFPTGGGKTEAYLGLTAFQIFFRRLVSKERRDYGGVDVIMRYTLRLLTVQQFQRAAALISACDLIRASNEFRFGVARISLGLYVGDDSTPNRLEDAENRLLDESKGQSPNSTPRQLLKCPVCGSDLPVSSYRVLHNPDRLDIICSSIDCKTAGLPLPVMTVDELIYASPPSLLIGTIDKFAQLPRRTDIRRIFGLDGTLRPGLIIQDELHLISGPLGSMTGLYEAAIDLVCTLDGVKPKIIGSTATIGRAKRQIRALFDRDVLQFPPPGFDASDSFFAVKDTDEPDRTYIGLSTAGRSPKFALQALIAAILQSVAYIRTNAKHPDSDIDPYWTCVAYFNSLRELGGAHVLMLDDVPRQINFIAGRLKSEIRALEGPPKELSSRVSSRDIPKDLLELERKIGNPDPFIPEPVYAVLASNMISVGVDISRLGLMVVNGQPKSTAEYIQATSRVGRGLPGLVVTLYNFGRPRDVSHYEHFQSYHGALYRGVEATSVTPWAPRARDKGLHAVLISLARHLVDGMLEDEQAIDFNPEDPKFREIVDYLIKRSGAGSSGLEEDDTRSNIKEIIRFWVRRSAESKATGMKLRYWEKRAPFGRTAPHLMRAAEEMKGQESLAMPTPNSMREVEPSTAFVLKRISRSKGEDNGNAA